MNNNIYLLGFILFPFSLSLQAAEQNKKEEADTKNKQSAFRVYPVVNTPSVLVQESGSNPTYIFHQSTYDKEQDLWYNVKNGALNGANEGYKQVVSQCVAHVLMSIGKFGYDLTKRLILGPSKEELLAEKIRQKQTLMTIIMSKQANNTLREQCQKLKNNSPKDEQVKYEIQEYLNQSDQDLESQLAQIINTKSEHQQYQLAEEASNEPDESEENPPTDPQEQQQLPPAIPDEGPQTPDPSAGA